MPLEPLSKNSPKKAEKRGMATSMSENDFLRDEDKPQKTKTEMFQEELSQYPDKETAKSHIAELAEKLDCSKGLGYKAIKRIDFGEVKREQELRAKEATIKIAEGKEEPLEEEPEEVEELEGEELEGEEFEPEEGEELERPELDAMTTLQPVLMRSLERIFNNAIDMVSGMEETLTSQESKDTAILLPFLIYRITKQKLTEDNFIDMTTVCHFGSIIVKVVNKKLKERRERNESIVKEPPKKAKETPQAPLETASEEPPQEPIKRERPKTAGFMKNL